jgi:agmatine/peptidylarginine deiminase
MITSAKSVLIFFLLVSLQASLFAQENEVGQDSSSDVKAKIESYHLKLNQSLIGLPKSSPNDVLRPYVEYEKAKYLLMSDETNFGSKDIKRSFAKNLPPDVDLVIVTNWGSESSIRKTYGEFLPQSRIKVIKAESSGISFWARDGIPVPVFKKNYDLALVDAKYYHNFEPDEKVSEYFSADLYEHPYYFEGGNFLADIQGNCVIVNNSKVAVAPDKIFESYYGCKNLLRLPHIDGIGHIDERVKFISETTAITDTKEYVGDLEKLGYKVVLMPRPEGKWETYVNSLLVNGTIFVPVFGQSKDQQVIEIYRSFGFKVVPLNSKSLSGGLGSLHCITMTYPEMQFDPEDKVEVKAPTAVNFDLEFVKSTGIEITEGDQVIEKLSCETKVNGNFRKSPNSLSKANLIKTLPKYSKVEAFYRSADAEWLLIFDGLEWGWMYEGTTLDCF